MIDVTQEIDNILPTLVDWPLVVDFSSRASGALRADALGVILGNIAEQAVAVMLNGRVLGGNARGHDVLLDDGTRVQVKSRLRTTYRGNSQFMKGETSEYDQWVGISFREDLSIEVAVSMASHDVESHGSKSRFTESQLKRLIGRS